MSPLTLTFLALLLVTQNVLMAQNNPSRQNAARLTVILTGLQSNKGNVKIGLYNSGISFFGKQKKFRGAILNIENKTVKWNLTGIPFGEYAIKAFHDEDNDNEIDTNFIGIPTEKYGFSNNAQGFFGPPGFDAAKFTIHSDSLTIRIHLR